MNAPDGPVVEHSPVVLEVVGWIPGRVIPKTIKIVVGASLFRALAWNWNNVENYVKLNYTHTYEHEYMPEYTHV